MWLEGMYKLFSFEEFIVILVILKAKALCCILTSLLSPHTEYMAAVKKTKLLQ